MNQAQTRSSLYQKIGKISFAIDELRLYLDTHPYCREALAMMQAYRQERDALMNEYEQSGGSFAGYETAEGDAWTWNEGPMPWEGENGYVGI